MRTATTDLEDSCDRPRSTDAACHAPPCDMRRRRPVRRCVAGSVVVVCLAGSAVVMVAAGDAGWRGAGVVRVGGSCLRRIRVRKHCGSGAHPAASTAGIRSLLLMRTVRPAADHPEVGAASDQISHPMARGSCSQRGGTAMSTCMCRTSTDRAAATHHDNGCRCMAGVVTGRRPSCVRVRAQWASRGVDDGRRRGHPA